MATKNELEELLYDLACDWKLHAAHVGDYHLQRGLERRLREVGVVDDRGWCGVMRSHTGTVHVNEFTEALYRRRPVCGAEFDRYHGTIVARSGKDVERMVTCKRCLAALKKGEL